MASGTNPDRVRSFTDDPLEAEASNELGRGAFIDHVAELIDGVGRQPSSTVLGMVGAWGLGKTTVLRAVAERLRRKGRPDEWIISEFNPWYFQDLPSLQTGFFRQLAAAIPDGWSLRKVRHKIADLADSLAPFSGMAAVAGVSPEATHRAAEMIRGGIGVQETQDALARALQKVGRPVLIIIDDVDRLDPDELALLFKLIRLVGRLPYVHYLLAYDEDTLLGALSQTRIAGGDSPRQATDYMEKIVQIRLDVPPIRIGELTAWVDREVKNLSAKFDWAYTAAVERRFERVYRERLRSRLRTPRAVRRFIAQAEAFAESVSSEVDLADYLILSWLRAAEPLVFRAIGENRSRLVVDESSLADRLLEMPRDVNAARQYWEQVLERARVDPMHLENVVAIISELFPKFKDDWKKVTNRSHSGSAIGRIAHPGYFDRFFAFAIPDGDISDVTVTAASLQILTGTEGTERTELERVWATDREMVLVKLEQTWSPGVTGGMNALRWLAARAQEAESTVEGTTSNPSVWLGQTLYTGLQGSEPVDAVIAMTSAQPSLLYAGEVLRVAVGNDAPPETRTEPFKEAQRILVSKLQRLFASLDTVKPPHYPREVWSVFWAWLAFDEDGVRAWVEDNVHHGQWTLLDFLCLLIDRRWEADGSGTVYIASRLNPDDVERTVGLARARSDLADLFAEKQRPVWRGAEATDSNLRSVVLQGLQAADEIRAE